MALLPIFKALYRSDFKYIELVEKLLVPLEDPLLIGLISLLYVIDRHKDSCPYIGRILWSLDLHSIDSRKLLLEFFH